jgi:hypothetical protein
MSDSDLESETDTKPSTTPEARGQATFTVAYEPFGGLKNAGQMVVSKYMLSAWTAF